MFSDVMHGIGITAWHAWHAMTVSPSKRPITGIWRNPYWEADEQHQQLVPPDTLRRDWRGRND